MPKILVVAATAPEIAPFLETQGIRAGHMPAGKLIESPADPHLRILITGAGMVNTAFALGRCAGEKFDLAVNAGVAGSFGKFTLGTVVNVTTDRFSELGAEDGDEFLPVDALGLGSQEVRPRYPFRNEITASLPEAAGITVNTVHGNDTSIARVLELFRPQVESMEGAAFLHAANVSEWNCLQLRAVSNTVEKRNRAAWDLDLAIGRLNEMLIRVIASAKTPSAS